MMKLATLLLATLADSLQNTLAAATTTRRRLQLTAACADAEDSFYFDTTHTVNGVALGGCYATVSSGAETHGVQVFTLNGDEQEDGDLVFFATASLTDDDDVLVWAVGVYATADDSHSKVCYDGDLQDVAENHPSAITSWVCLDGTSSENEILTESTCSCTTPPPTPSLTSPTTPFPTKPSTPSPTSLSTSADTSPNTRHPNFTPAPTATPPLTPQPSFANTVEGNEAASSEDEGGDSRWLDAVWEIVVTITGAAMVAAGAACGSFLWRRSSAQSGAVGVP